MNAPNGNDLILGLLQAPPEKQAMVAKYLAGAVDLKAKERQGPLLLAMGEAARFLGVSRPTLWRMIQAKRLSRVEILPGSFRVVREELERLAEVRHAAAGEATV